jgi:hypothetical protein
MRHAYSSAAVCDTDRQDLAAAAGPGAACLQLCFCVSLLAPTEMCHLHTVSVCSIGLLEVPRAPWWVISIDGMVYCRPQLYQCSSLCHSSSRWV